MNADKSIELLRNLVKIPSPCGEEKQVGEYIYKKLKKRFDVKKQKVGDRYNIIATIGTPRIIFTTHMDTVPSQIPFDEDNKYIYGRGACDAKGPMAAMIVAMENAIDNGYTNLGLVIDVGEEDDFAGIIEFVKNPITYNPELVIIGEPTDFKIINGQKGLLTIKIETYGKSAHGSTPEKGICAITKCLEILERLKQFNWPDDKLLGKTTINIGLIEGGTSANTVSDYAQATIEIRTTIKNSTLLEKIKKILTNAKVTIINNYDPKFSRANITIKKETMIAPYFTEMYFWKNSIVFGPGKPKYAHADNERISKKDLIKAVKWYYKIINKYMGNFKK